MVRYNEYIDSYEVLTYSLISVELSGVAPESHVCQTSIFLLDDNPLSRMKYPILTACKAISTLQFVEGSGTLIQKDRPSSKNLYWLHSWRPDLESNQIPRFFRPLLNDHTSSLGFWFTPPELNRASLCFMATPHRSQLLEPSASGPDGNRTRHILIDSEVSPPGELKT